MFKLGKVSKETRGAPIPQNRVGPCREIAGSQQLKYA